MNNVGIFVEQKKIKFKISKTRFLNLNNLYDLCIIEGLDNVRSTPRKKNYTSATTKKPSYQVFSKEKNANQASKD